MCRRATGILLERLEGVGHRPRLRSHRRNRRGPSPHHGHLAVVSTQSERVSTAHLDRLEELMRSCRRAEARRAGHALHRLVERLPFHAAYLEKEPFYTSPKWAAVQELYLAKCPSGCITHPQFSGLRHRQRDQLAAGRVRRPRAMPGCNASSSRCTRCAPAASTSTAWIHDPWFTGRHLFAGGLSGAAGDRGGCTAGPSGPARANTGSHLDEPYTQLPRGDGGAGAQLWRRAAQADLAAGIRRVRR